jgi:hypothetical protein
MTNPEADAYIAGAPAYAQPILRRVRAAFHRVCPEVAESLKWSQPTFSYRGKILAGMGAFKRHVRFHFWHSAALPDPEHLFKSKDDPEGHGMKLTTAADLPSDEVLDAYIAQSMRLQETGGVKSRPVLIGRPSRLWWRRLISWKPSARIRRRKRRSRRCRRATAANTSSGSWRRNGTPLASSASARRSNT